MFLNFKIANYRSIGKELLIDFSIRDSQKLGAFAEINGQAVNNIACLVGPNASGKSNVLKGIVHLLNCMRMSYSMPSFRYTRGFTSHFCCKDSPTEFSTEFIDNETQYKYEVSILNGIVQNEILLKRDETTKRYSYLFNREIGKDISFGKAVKINKRDLNRLGDDMSLLSLMLELNYFEKNDFLLLRKFHSNVYLEFSLFDYDPSLRLSYLSQILQNDSNLMEELIDELKAIDTGISSLELKKNKSQFRDIESRKITNELEFITILTRHKVANNEYPLNMLEESSGTLHYIETFINLSSLLQNGGLFIADELEQSLHPDLTGRIISRFMNKDKNPNNAQLLFTTHNPWFLQDLTKTQIFITEKNDEAETEITRLDEIAGVRNDENYFMKYIAGEYDGRPKIREA
jgi:AAA15 family ATPase/GTPase